MAAELTTVADDLAVVHDGAAVHRFDGLVPDHTYELAGVAVRTLSRPAGELLCRFVTVNDVHFGEVECGVLDGERARGPVLRVAPGAEPHPELMNRAAVAEIAALDPAAVVVKGDLTLDGADHEYAAFLDCYGAFGERLHAVRGNHDRYHHQTYAAGDRVIDLPGVRIALMDTTIAGGTTGAFEPDQLDWLDTVAAEADRPVMAMGHHHDWTPANRRSATYFGIDPDSSEALHAVMARRGIVGWFAGHTHRNRVRTTPASNGAVHVEVGTVKDFPGSYAEYRVHEGGILQVHHRVSSPEALAWSERCRALYADFGTDYVAYALGRLEDRVLRDLDALTDADVRVAYADAVRWFVATVAAVPAARWDDRATDTLTVGELVGHTARSLSLLGAYLDAPAQRVSFVGRTGHTKALFAPPVPTQPRDLRERAADTLRDLGGDVTSGVTDDVAGYVARAVARLGDAALARLDAAPDDAVCTTPLGSIALADHLPSRVGELMVYTLDLHKALGDAAPAAPPLPIEVALAFVHALANPVMAILALTGRIGYDVFT